MQYLHQTPYIKITTPAVPAEKAAQYNTRAVLPLPAVPKTAEQPT
jgi:hypothetical protein